jgi:hypothetical protein
MASGKSKMGFGFKAEYVSQEVARQLEERGVISKTESEAIVTYIVTGGDMSVIKEMHKGRSKRDCQRHGDSKLIDTPDYYKEIERKVNDHIIPFVKKQGMYKILKKTKNKEKSNTAYKTSLIEAIKIGRTATTLLTRGSISSETFEDVCAYLGGRGDKKRIESLYNIRAKQGRPTRSYGNLIHRGDEPFENIKHLVENRLAPFAKRQSLPGLLLREKRLCNKYKETILRREMKEFGFD